MSWEGPDQGRVPEEVPADYVDEPTTPAVDRTMSFSPDEELLEFLQNLGSMEPETVATGFDQKFDDVLANFIDNHEYEIEDRTLGPLKQRFKKLETLAKKYREEHQTSDARTIKFLLASKILPVVRDLLEVLTGTKTLSAAKTRCRAMLPNSAISSLSGTAGQLSRKSKHKWS